ncbi:MAG: Ig-like domain-containing protein [Bacteroidota bacterium]
MKRLQAFLAIIFGALLVYSCAQRSRPDGGPIDEEPPKVMKESPVNYSTLFKRDKIVIDFNEFIKLEDPRNQIIFSPPIEPRPTISPMGLASKNVTIEFDRDSLLPNTTYTVNFGTSIEDNNEGNKFPYYKYVFSTGDYLDSLKINGQVFDPLQRIADENISVMLYPKDEHYSDSTVYQSKPTYIAYTRDSLGNFTLENIKEGSYKIIALSDKMNNYIFDPKQDKIGFLEEEINLPEENKNSFQLQVFKEDLALKPQRPSQVSRQHIIFGYSGKITEENHEINILSDVPENFRSRITKEKDADTLNYWFDPYVEKDSLLFTFSDGKKIDTLQVNPKQIEKDSLVVEAAPKGNINFEETFKLSAKVPFETYDPEKISVFNIKDSVEVDFKINFDSYKNQLIFDFEKEEEKSYEIEVLPGGITSFFEEENDSLSYKVSTKKYSDYGNIALTIRNIKQFPAIVQLVDKDNKVKYEQYSEENKLIFEFNLLEPGEYFLRVIYDENGNQEWDTGNYLKNIQPETSDYLHKLIKIRANWDTSEEVSLPN